MKAFFSKIRAAVKALQVRQFVAIALMGALLLTTSVDEANLSANAKARLNDIAAQGETGRPRTSGQWEARNEALQGNPGEQLKQIAEQTVDAVGEMAEIYPQNAKTLAPGMDNGRLPRDD